MRHVLKATFLFAVLLSSCASLSESECRGKDWADLGRLDGARGRSAAEFEKHREACVRHGVKPDETAYHASRMEALKVYCTPQGGYVAGRRRENYQDVCPAAASKQFRPAFRDGREVGLIVQELKDLQRRMDDLETEPLTTGDLSPEARTQRRFELMELRREYDLRQGRAERLDERYSKKYHVDPLRDLDYRQ